MLVDYFVQRYTSIPICKFESNLITTTLPPVNHKDFEIFFVKEGCAYFTANEQTLFIEKGTILFLSPYMLHGLSVPEGMSLEYVSICFDLLLVPNDALVSDLENNRFFITPLFYAGTEHYPTLHHLYSEIDQALGEDKPFWEIKVQGYLNLLFAYLMQHGLYYKSSTPSKEMTFCLHVMNYLEAHYSENITSRQIAEDLHYTQSYFCRLFKKNFGICFNEYLCTFRLEKAKLSLANSKNISITDIVSETGFFSASYFTKKFREQNGISPKEFRRINLSRP